SWLVAGGGCTIMRKGSRIGIAAEIATELPEKSGDFERRGTALASHAGNPFMLLIRAGRVERICVVNGRSPGPASIHPRLTWTRSRRRIAPTDRHKAS